MRIYISVPISGHPIEQQRAKASEIAEKLKELGHEPVNPFDTPEAPEDLSDKEKYAYYMGEDIKRLLLCDAIFMCVGWSRSIGCSIERAVAQNAGLLIYEHFVDNEGQVRPISMLGKFKL